LANSSDITSANETGVSGVTALLFFPQTITVDLVAILDKILYNKYRQNLNKQQLEGEKFKSSLSSSSF